MDATRLLLKNYQSPGDILMLTAAVRDLHLNYPGRFLTGLDTSCRPLWDHNPRVTRHHPQDERVRVVDCHYPLINQSNQLPRHFVEAFTAFLNDRLGLKMKTTAFKGDVHLSYDEIKLPSRVQQLCGRDIPFWIIVGGGKEDYPIKWWNRERWQAVVDHFAGRICFVQIGEMTKGHVHPRLTGAIDLRGETTLRELVHLMYHAQGVVCPVTMAMHLAAAVQGRPDRPRLRPCVVVSGGREPHQFVAYPGHQFIHTIGALQCCAMGGCWKSRVVPYHDGDEKDKHLCFDPRGDLPRCMEMITPAEVCRRIETYFDGGMLNYLAPEQWQALLDARLFDDSRRRNYDQEKWPLPVRLLLRWREPADLGIGDIVARKIAPMGGDAFKEWHLKTFGRDCGCPNRQQALNHNYPLK